MSSWSRWSWTCCSASDTCSRRIADWQPLEAGAPASVGAPHYLEKGTDAALYAVLEAIVDGNFPMVEREILYQLANRENDLMRPASRRS